MAYFPMFINLEGEPCLIVGGGKIALRKVQVLRDFGAQVTVAAPEILEEIKSADGVICLYQEYSEELLNGMKLVVAATADAGKNRDISKKCKELGIPVNAVDQMEDCTFIFPSYIRSQDLVAAFSSSGKSPLMTQYLKSQIEPSMTSFTGDLTEYLGSIRTEVKAKVATEPLRKKVYQQVLGYAMEHESLPDAAELDRMIKAVNGL